MFENEKKQILCKEDFSTKGSVDEKIKPLLERINSKKDYYTTSSCSGRILLINILPGSRKAGSEWLFVNHEKTDPSQITKALEKTPDSEVWFKMEAAILHVACRTIEDAFALLDIAKKAGFKHSGIFSAEKKIIVEIIGNEKMETILTKDRKILVNNEYLEELVSAANSKLAATHICIDKLYELLKNK